MIDRPRPDFLAPVGPEERNPWRIVAWICAAVAAYLLVGSLAVLAFHLALPQVAVQAFLAHRPFSGPQRLELEGSLFACAATASLICGLGLLTFSRNIFARPAWTFVTPVRPWAWGLTVSGAACGALMLAALLAIDAAFGETNPMPVLDPHFALEDRIIFALSLVPVTLMMVVSQEIIFRGVLLQIVGAFLPNRVVLALLSGALYAIARGDPTTGAMLHGILVGGALSWAVLELGGMEFGVGAQFLQLWAALMLGPLVTSEIGKKPDWTVSPADAVELGVTVLVIVLGVWLIKRINRRSLNL